VEYDVGVTAVNYINRSKHIYLPKEEAVGIALHLINAGYSTTPQAVGIKNQEELIGDIAELIEEKYDIKIDREGFNFSRFVTHIRYLLIRRDEEDQLNTENNEILTTLIEKYPETYQLVLKVREIIEANVNFKINDEELVYLMLHVNRLCTREECDL
jgi:beta-glucoside operon transcriptional antiterminator